MLLIDFDMTAWGIGFSLLGLTLLFLRKRGRPYLLCLTVFWIYLLFVVREAFFPIPLFDEIQRQPVNYVLAHINLMPFNYLGFFNAYAVFLEIFLNILFSVPFGFGISFITRLKAADAWKPALLFGSMVEAGQLSLSLLSGGVYRTVDVTDVLLNALGVFLGYGIFCLFAWLFVKMAPQFALHEDGLLAYVHAVCRDKIKVETS